MAKFVSDFGGNNDFRWNLPKKAVAQGMRARRKTAVGEKRRAHVNT
jgi:hypothetical protein